MSAVFSLGTVALVTVLVNDGLVLGRTSLCLAIWQNSLHWEELEDEVRSESTLLAPWDIHYLCWLPSLPIFSRHQHWVSHSWPNSPTVSFSDLGEPDCPGSNWHQPNLKKITKSTAMLWVLESKGSNIIKWLFQINPYGKFIINCALGPDLSLSFSWKCQQMMLVQAILSSGIGGHLYKWPMGTN